MLKTIKEQRRLDAVLISIWAVLCSLVKPSGVIFAVKQTGSVMSWKTLTDIAQLEEIIEKSALKTQVIFKHSIRCSISSVAKGRLERSEFPSDVDFYYLDLINYRELSNKISEV